MMQKKIRVLFLQSRAKPWSLEKVHRLLLQNFDQERVEIHMACAVGPGGAKTPSYTFFEAVPDLYLRPTNFGTANITDNTSKFTAKSLLATGLAAPGTLLGLTNYVKQHHIDIIHAPEKSRDVFTSIFLKKMTGAKAVIHLHLLMLSWMGGARLRAMKQADGIIGVSAYVADSAIAMGYQAEKVYHSLNSVDPGEWDYQMDGSSIRQEFHIPPDALVFTITGHTTPYKGHKQLLQALGQIKDRLPDFRLMIVGGDTAEYIMSNGGYVPQLQEQARDLGLSQQVIFMGMRSDVPAILAASDLFTMPSSGEACPMAILEAMAMKKAIVALDEGGPRELVEHGKSGLLSQQGDIQQLAEYILTLANDPDLRKQMGECARRRVEEYLNPQRQANEVEQIYRRVLAGRQAPDREPVAVSVQGSSRACVTDVPPSVGWRDDPLPPAAD
jgi:glycosyltransferase involved in cell wall biosynthesis